MIKRITIILFISVVESLALADDPNSMNLLRDGFVLSGVDGTLVARGQKWFFELDKSVSDGTAILEAGTKIEMINSAGLEKMIDDLKERPQGSYRLFNAVVTRYKGNNYIFSDYFLPLTDAAQSGEQKEQSENQSVPELAINEPNDIVVIPEEIIEKLQSRRIIRPDKTRGKLELKQDSILANRTGFIVEQKDGTHEFVFDALGQNMPRVSLELLPCFALERAESKQASDPGRKLYKVSGVVTKYKDKYYLLLQQVTRAYGYGNFGT